MGLWNASEISIVVEIGERGVGNVVILRLGDRAAGRLAMQ